MKFHWQTEYCFPLHLKKRRTFISKKFVFLLVVICSNLAALGQQFFSPRELKKLSVEELMNVEVTLVSRTPEKLTETASAIQVITGEDIRRSGATNLPEALRLAPNLQVAQYSSNIWIISARGFNNIFSNKLLVMIDGRTVYTPLYGGVLWEQQNVLLEDVERIEVVSGPGGTLWGANAVNGVINIVTKHTRQTKGLYASASAGTFLKGAAALRYSGKLGKNAWYKAYGQYLNHNPTHLQNGADNNDAWKLLQAGFRIDWDASVKDKITLQGDYYDGRINSAADRSPLNGQNLLARWSRQLSPTADFSTQVYYDRYFRADAPSISSDEMNTLDADFQHRFAPGKKHTMVWGAGFRYVKDNAYFAPAAIAVISPRYKQLNLFNAFAQDEFMFSQRWRLNGGIKLLHNVYTGWEWQPNLRLAWQKPQSTLWAAISRVVRTPSRFDVDYYLPLAPQPPSVPSIAGGPSFVSEKLLAYEAGYRLQPNKKSSFSLSLFYNQYRDLYSVEAKPGTLTYQIQNGSAANAWGAELSTAYQLLPTWQVKGGYTFFAKNIYAKKDRAFNPDYLGNDARNQVLLQSMLDLPFHLHFDLTARYRDPLQATIATAYISSYHTLDARLAYINNGWEVAVVGQNLERRYHREFGPFEIPRSVYAKISARF